MRGIFVFVLVVVHVGVVVGRQQATPGLAPSAEPMAALMSEGQEVYGADCMECHSEGGIGPVFAGDAALANKDRVIKSILAGLSGGDMPDFGPTLTDRKIAAVSTFIRNAWDNSYGIVLEADVKRLREETKMK